MKSSQTASEISPRLWLPVCVPLLLIACQTTQVQEVQEVVVAPPAVTLDCVPISTLTRVDIPPKTETFTAITQIDNPPYDPIERREKQTRVIEDGYTLYVDSNGREVTNTCKEGTPETGS